MGCGCGKKIARSKAKKAKRSATKNTASVIRKRRISKLVSIPGKSSTRKVAKRTKG